MNFETVKLNVAEIIGKTAKLLRLKFLNFGRRSL
jgi:hypothetical protein